VKCDRSAKRNRASRRAIAEHTDMMCCFAAAGVPRLQSSKLAYREIVHPGSAST
jgi:hypothetical protein